MYRLIGTVRGAYRSPTQQPTSLRSARQQRPTSMLEFRGTHDFWRLTYLNGTNSKCWGLVSPCRDASTPGSAPGPLLPPELTRLQLQARVPSGWNLLLWCCAVPVSDEEEGYVAVTKVKVCMQRCRRAVHTKKGTGPAAAAGAASRRPLQQTHPCVVRPPSSKSCSSKQALHHSQHPSSRQNINGIPHMRRLHPALPRCVQDRRSAPGAAHTASPPHSVLEVHAHAILWRLGEICGVKLPAQRNLALPL